MIEIGSADAPVILGVSNFATPFQLWLEKVGIVKREDRPDEVMKSGKRLEDYVLDMECEEAGFVAKEVWRQMTARRLFLRATPDGAYSDLTADDEITHLFEVKTLVGQPPPMPRVSDVVQCLHQLLVFEDAACNRLIYFGGLRRERFIIPRHQRALDRVLRAEEAFLELVEKETPPPVVAADCDGLWRGWPLVADEVRTLPEESKAWDLIALEAGREKEDAEERYSWARAQIKAAMGPATQAVVPGTTTRYTWRPDVNGRRALKRKGRDNGEEA